MAYLRPSRPTDLPELRAHLLDDPDIWQTLHRLGLIGEASRYLLETLDAPPSGIADLAALGSNFEAPEALHEGLAQAALWWIGRDCCQLLAQAAPSMPPVTLTPDLVPDAHGFAAFEQPMRATAAGGPSDLDALMQLLDLPEAERREVRRQAGQPPSDGVSFDFVQWLPTNVKGHSSVSIIVWALSPEHPQLPPVPLGRSDWVFGQQTDDRLPGLSETAHASVVEDRRLVAALWQLSSQPSMTTANQVSVDRAARRRLARNGHQAPPVRLINLSPRQRRNVEGTGAGREYSCQWIVRPHWRQQAYGPGRALRKAILIDQHIRGPADKPLQVRDAVKVWRQQ